MFDLSLVDEYFHSFGFADYREGQKETIEWILESFDKGKRFCVIEAPTGAGKSAIGMTVARFFQRSFYLTAQKILQSQLGQDFSTMSDDIVDLRGRSNYDCTWYQNFGDSAVRMGGMARAALDKALRVIPDCNTGFCRKVIKRFKADQCFARPFVDDMRFSSCPYYEQVYRAIASRMVLMNYSSFLYQLVMTTRFDKRDLLIIDEAHQTEPQLLEFVSITLNDKKLKNLDVEIPKLDLAEEYWLYFAEVEILGKIGAIIEAAKESEDVETQDEYVQLYFKIRGFMEAMEAQEEWVAEFKAADHFNSVTIKPVFVHGHADRCLFNHGEKVLMMSATILDVNIVCQSLGINRDQIAAKRLRNRFPIKNRPIYLRSAGRIVGGPDKMKNWAGKLVEQADGVLSHYPDNRGIIHTHNFAIADLLMNRSAYKARFLYQKNFKSKDEMLAVHADSTNTVIVAPAMHEGLDLRGDLSRFQIICKIPWPNFIDDKQLARRVDIDRRYLLWLTALKLVQSSGRSVRSETDWAHTYVLDEVFLSFLQDAKDMIPSWFHEAVDLKN